MFPMKVSTVIRGGRQQEFPGHVDYPAAPGACRAEVRVALSLRFADCPCSPVGFGLHGAGSLHTDDREQGWDPSPTPLNAKRKPPDLRNDRGLPVTCQP